MSHRTREINRITTTIITVSLKLIIFALVLLILYQGATRGYAFGHEVFAPTPVSPEPAWRFPWKSRRERTSPRPPAFSRRRASLRTLYFSAAGVVLRVRDLSGFLHLFHRHGSMEMLQMLRGAEGDKRGVMIVNDRITAYINSLDMGNGELLDAIARRGEAGRDPRP